MKASGKPVAASSDGNLSIREYREEDDVNVALVCGLPLEEWAWKHRLSPNFDPRFVIVAESRGRIVGVTHAQRRRLSLGKSLTLDASQGADLFVRPEHRRTGIGRMLVQHLRRNLKQGGVLLHYGLSQPGVYETFYVKTSGYLFLIPRELNSIAIYVKDLSLARLRKKIDSVNSALEQNADLRNELKGLRLAILFHALGFPRFALVVRGGCLSLEEEGTVQPDVTVTATRIPLSWKAALRMLCSGDLRIRSVLHKPVTFHLWLKVARLAAKEVVREVFLERFGHRSLGRICRSALMQTS